jgi:hypothetical protein
MPRGLALARELLEQQAVGEKPLDPPRAIECLQIKLSCSYTEAERLVALIQTEDPHGELRT